MNQSEILVLCEGQKEDKITKSKKDYANEKKVLKAKSIVIISKNFFSLS